MSAMVKGITLTSALFSIVAMAAPANGADENGRKASAASPVRALPGDTTARVDFNIPNLALADALAEWSRQTGLQVLRRETDSAFDLTTRSIVGKFSPAEALEKMLATTGLTYEFVNDRTVRIAPASSKAETTSFSSGGRGAKRIMLAQNTAVPPRAALPREASPSAHSSGASSSTSQEVLQEVLVTGSRIARSSFTTTTPMLAIDSADIARSGFNNLSDILLRSPLVAAGIGAATANYNADAGASFIDLRGLGVQRTLTLIDGRRRVAGTQMSSAVDLSAIPAALVERIEVITGGASAVYGADAVTGVVNVVLKRDFDGLEAFARAGQSKYGDGNSYSAGLTGGTAFSEARGHLSFGFSYTEDHPIFLRDRPFARQNPTTIANPANTGPADGIPDIITIENWRIRDVSVPGTFTVGGVSYLYDGQLRPLQNDQVFGNFGIAGDGFTNVPYNPVRVGLKTLSGLTDLRYDLGDSVSLFVQLSMANTRTHDPRQPMSDRGMIIQRDNPFVPAAIQQLMDDNDLTQISLGRSQRDLGIQYNDTDRTTYTLLVGLEGTLADDWRWQLAYQYGRNDYTSHTRSRNQARFLQAIDVITDPETLQPVCRSPEARAAGCVPLNVIGIDVASPAALDWIIHTRVRDIETTQQIVSGQISGDLLDLPAGALKFVAGGEYRKEGLATQDDGLAVTGGLYRLDNGGPPIDAGFDVSEAFVEVVAPLLRDLPFAHRLEIEGAARYSDYSTIGDTIAWKAGALWAPSTDLRLRVTRSRSVRAPTLNELFSPGVNSLVNVVDPCGASQINANPNRVANCAALGVPEGWVDQRNLTARTLTTGGNSELEEEPSDSWTAGVVLTPSWFQNLSLSVDFWSIKLRGAIASVDAQKVIDLCVDSPSIDNVFCSAIDRVADHTIEVVRTTPINIGRLEAEGFDLQVQYQLDLARFSRLRGNLLLALTGTRVNDLREIVNEADPTSVIVRSDGIRSPTWRGNLYTRYALDSWGASWNLRYIDSARVDPSRPMEYYDRPTVGSRVYHDLHASYDLNDAVNVYAGINNLLNEMPPLTAQTYQGVGDGALYDNLGRFFFVGGTIRF